MIYDCFQISNELEILDIRLHELAEVVDKFVIVESTVSHSLKPKRLYFNENKDKFKTFKNKIIHIIVKDTPDVTLPWIANDYQFCQMMRGLKNCTSSDIIIFGDLDEVPRADAIRQWKDRPGKLKIFSQTLSQYYLNYIDSAKGPWYGARMTTYRQFLQYKSPWIAKFSHPDVIIPNGGWHLTYMGGIKRIRKKLANMTHQEYNNSRYNTPEHIFTAIYAGEDFLENGFRFKVTSLDFLPDYVRDNQEKFKALLLDENKQVKLSRVKKALLASKKFTRMGLRALRERK